MRFRTPKDGFHVLYAGRTCVMVHEQEDDEHETVCFHATKSPNGFTETAVEAEVNSQGTMVARVDTTTRGRDALCLFLDTEDAVALARAILEAAGEE